MRTLTEKLYSLTQPGRDRKGFVRATAKQAKDALDRIRAICEDGERSGADRLDEIYRIVTGEE